MQPLPTPQIDLPLPAGSLRVLWQSAHDWKPPHRIEPANDSWRVERAYRALSQGTGLLWLGDYRQARQLLAAIKRRLDKTTQAFESIELPDRFHRVRQQRSQAARQAGLLLVQILPGYRVALSQSPPVLDALEMAYGDRLKDQHFAMPLSELVGVLSAFEWHRQGLPVTTLGHSVHPRWGVFAPTRHEYLDLVMQADLPKPCTTAVDVGTGTGVLAMLLAKRGVARVLATDTNPAAVACATDNVRRAQLEHQVEVVNKDLMPEGKFDLIACNPPWLPGAASGPLEAAVYDPGHRMLRGFLANVGAHLAPNGQAWLILSDLAEHLKLRTREQLLAWIEQAGLVVVNKLQVRPTHRKLENTSDPLAAFRRAETTSLWQLQLSSSGETP